MTRILAPLLFVLVCCAAEEKHYTFSTGADALRSDLVTRGWLPTWLPSSATDVDLQYDLDTNQVWLSFSPPERERGKTLAAFDVIPEQDVSSLSFRHAPDESKWFESLIVQSPENDNGLHAAVYRTADGLVFADKLSNRVYFYGNGN